MKIPPYCPRVMWRCSILPEIQFIKVIFVSELWYYHVTKIFKIIVSSSYNCSPISYCCPTLGPPCIVMLGKKRLFLIHLLAVLSYVLLDCIVTFSRTAEELTVSSVDSYVIARQLSYIKLGSCCCAVFFYWTMYVCICTGMTLREPCVSVLFKTLRFRSL